MQCIPMLMPFAKLKADSRVTVEATKAKSRQMAALKLARHEKRTKPRRPAALARCESTSTQRDVDKENDNENVASGAVGDKADGDQQLVGGVDLRGVEEFAVKVHLDKLLSRGGFADVYRGECFGRDVAVKVLRTKRGNAAAHEAAAAAMMREAVFGAALLKVCCS